jgi:hypothetical protein
MGALALYRQSTIMSAGIRSDPDASLDEIDYLSSWIRRFHSPLISHPKPRLSSGTV